MQDLTPSGLRSRAKPKQEKTCLRCGATFTAKKVTSAHCSLDCSSKASEARRQLKRNTAAGLYDPYPCNHCGTMFHRATRQKVYCTDKCKDAYNGKRRLRKSRAKVGLPDVAVCTICGDDHYPRLATSKICPKRDCRNKLTVLERMSPCLGCEALGQYSARKMDKGYCRTCKPVQRRAPMAIATLAKDYPKILELMRSRSTVTDSGCWEWQGPKSTGGYGCVSGAKRLDDGTEVASAYVAHRLSLEAKLGRDLGAMQSHHACANRICVNPDHLQPVTTAQNMGEMRARKSYEARIEELEDALRALNPSHPALMTTLAA